MSDYIDRRSNLLSMRKVLEAPVVEAKAERLMADFNRLKEKNERLQKSLDRALDRVNRLRKP